MNIGRMRKQLAGHILLKIELKWKIRLQKIPFLMMNKNVKNSYGENMFLHPLDEYT